MKVKIITISYNFSKKITLYRITLVRKLHYNLIFASNKELKMLTKGETEKKKCRITWDLKTMVAIFAAVIGVVALAWFVPIGNETSKKEMNRSENVST